MPVLHSYVWSSVLMAPNGTGTEPDAAKLQHSVIGLRWKRVRNSGDGPPGCTDVPQGKLRRKAVPKHVCIFLETDPLWRTHYAHLARQCCVPSTPRAICFSENIFCCGHAAGRERWLGPGSTCGRNRGRRSIAKAS